MPGAQHVHERPLGGIPAWARPNRNSRNSGSRSRSGSRERLRGSSGELMMSSQSNHSSIPPELRTSFESHYGGSDEDLMEDQSNIPPELRIRPSPPMLTAETVHAAAVTNGEERAKNDNDDSNVYDGVTVDTIKKKERRNTFIGLVVCMFLIGIISGAVSVATSNLGSSTSSTTSSSVADSNDNSSIDVDDNSDIANVDSDGGGDDDVKQEIDPEMVTQQALLLAERLSHLSPNMDLVDLVDNYKFYFATGKTPSFPITPQVEAIYWLAKDPVIIAGSDLNVLNNSNGNLVPEQPDSNTNTMKREFQSKLEQRYALAVFYYATINNSPDQDWIYKTNFPETSNDNDNNQHVDICDWYNVTCNEERDQVTELWYGKFFTNNIPL